MSIKWIKFFVRCRWRWLKMEYSAGRRTNEIEHQLTPCSGRCSSFVIQHRRGTVVLLNFDFDIWPLIPPGHHHKPTKTHYIIRGTNERIWYWVKLDSLRAISAFLGLIFLMALIARLITVSLSIRFSWIFEILLTRSSKSYSTFSQDLVDLEIMVKNISIWIVAWIENTNKNVDSVFTTDHHRRHDKEKYANKFSQKGY